MNSEIIKILTLPIPVRRHRHLVRAFLLNGGMRLLKKDEKLKFYYYRGENFGDALNLPLLRYFSCNPIYAPEYFADVCCIGSILDDFLVSPKLCKNSRPLHVYGSGFMYEHSEHTGFCRPLIIHALRGKLTCMQCERILNRKLSSVILGDPGLLTAEIFSDVRGEAKYDVGFICHYADDEETMKQCIKLKSMSYKFIDVALPPAEFVKSVSECRFIASSAMHGLICADSLGIPNKHILVSNKVKGNGFKFRDYYSVYNNVEYEPYVLNNAIIDDATIYRFMYEYHISPNEVRDICGQLKQAFSDLASVQ